MLETASSTDYLAYFEQIANSLVNFKKEKHDRQVVQIPNKEYSLNFSEIEESESPIVEPHIIIKRRNNSLPEQLSTLPSLAADSRVLQKVVEVLT